MKKYFIIFIILFSFTACTIKQNIPLDDKFQSKKNHTMDWCTNFSYISNIEDEKYGKLFVEYIDLDLSCNWNGFARGYFDDLFKSTLKLKSLNAIERIDYKNYEFSTYLIDDKYYLNLIYQFGAKDNYFLIDYDGKYFDELIKTHLPNYVNKSLNQLRFSSDYHNSLVKMNIINSYFSKERETIEK